MVADGHGRDEELLADGRRRQPLGEAAEDLLLARRQIDRLSRLRGDRPERLPFIVLFGEAALESRHLLLPVTKDVNDRRERGMVGRDGEEGDLDVLAPAGPRL